MARTPNPTPLLDASFADPEANAQQNKMRERIDHPGQGLHRGPENQPGAQHNPWSQAIQQNTGGQLREAVGERKGGEQHPKLGGAKAQVRVSPPRRRSAKSGQES